MFEYMGIYFMPEDPEEPWSTPIFHSVEQVEEWANAHGAVDLDITEREVPF